MGKKIDENVKKFLHKNCTNSNLVNCKNMINHTENYIKWYNQEIEKYKSQINNAKTIIKDYKYRFFMPPMPNINTNSHINSHMNSDTSLDKNLKNNISGNKCNNLDAHSCRKEFYCKWHSKNKLCKPDKNFCINKNKKLCNKDSEKCTWMDNSCHNSSKLKTR